MWERFVPGRKSRSPKTGNNPDSLIGIVRPSRHGSWAAEQTPPTPETSIALEYVALGRCMGPLAGRDGC